MTQVLGQEAQTNGDYVFLVGYGEIY